MTPSQPESPPNPSRRRRRRQEKSDPWWREGSNVIWMDDTRSHSSDDSLGTSTAHSNNSTTPHQRPRRRVRVAKLLGLQGLTVAPTVPHGSVRTINPTALYNAYASFLAAQEFNRRSGAILPQLPDLLRSNNNNNNNNNHSGQCTFYWSYEFRDTQFSELEATRQLLDSWAVAEENNNNNTNNNINDQEGRNRRLEHLPSNVTGNHALPPGITEATASLASFAIAGAYRSPVTEIVGLVAQGRDIPTISGASTARTLDDVPLVARTVPHNHADAYAALLYYGHSLHITHLAVLYHQDSWGIQYHAALAQYAPHWGITLKSFSCTHTNESIHQALQDLKASQFRHVFAVMPRWEPVVRAAVREGVLGNSDYAWVVAEQTSWTDHRFTVPRDTDADLAGALHGVGILHIHVEPNHRFDRAMQQLEHDTHLQQAFVAVQADPRLFDNFIFPPYAPTEYDRHIFDAVLALGITACNPSNQLVNLFTGPEFYRALLTTEFEGLSGPVAFDPITGSRRVGDVKYAIQNIVLSEARSDAQTYRFETNLVSIMQGNETTNYQSFVYFDNTTRMPPALPVVDEELNLLPRGAQIYGYVLASMVMMLSLVCGIWTYRQQHVFVLRASQPHFLCQLCGGIFIMALAVFPASLPGASTVGSVAHTVDSVENNGETDRHTGLDAACMSAVWLAFVGFVIGFSALASKTWRLNQLMEFGRAMQHANVGVHDAMVPLYVSMTVNVTLLLCVTFISPLRYERFAQDNFDGFGRSLESFRTCAPADHRFFYFVGALSLFNFMGVVLTTREAYKARDVPVDFSDGKSLAYALLSLLETLMLGGPLLLVVYDNPTAFVLIGSSLLCVGCLTILLLLYIPKYTGRHRKHRMCSVVQAISRNNLSSASGHGGSSGRRRFDEDDFMGGVDTSGAGESNRRVPRSASGLSGMDDSRHLVSEMASFNPNAAIAPADPSRRIEDFHDQSSGGIGSSGSRRGHPGRIRITRRTSLEARQIR